MTYAERLKNAVDMATKYGQDRTDAFLRAHERLTQKHSRPDMVSWSKRILSGGAVQIASEDGEHWADISFSHYYDDELAHEEYLAGQIHSPYDCTGLPFMYGIHYFRAFGGYVIITYWSYDI